MKAKFLMVTLSLVFTFSGTKAFAQDGIGLGGELISPTGVSYKVPINENSAITGAVGFLISESFSSATIDVNYLMYRDNENITIGSGDLSPYVGGGVSLQFRENSDTQISLQIPVGLEYRIDNSPFEVYMDVGPYVRLTDPVYLTLQSSLGFRYRFN